MRINAAPSLLHRRIARLQRSRGEQAGTGCHEDGIILSKKPPKWLQSPPHQRSASDSISIGLVMGVSFGDILLYDSVSFVLFVLLLLRPGLMTIIC